MAVISASVIGRSHRRQGRSGQDAWSMCAAAAAAGDGADTAGGAPGGLVAAVADGCSAGRCSQIGAGVGARVAVASAVRRQRGGTALADLPALVVADVVEELRRLARATACDAEDIARVVEEALLFTLHVAVTGRGAAREQCVVFGIGDGVVSIDGRVRVVEQGDAPDYPAYALFPDMAQPRLLVHHVGSFASLAICTDGARELVERAHERLPDGSPLGGLVWFERDERILRNASLAQKRLLSWCDATGGPVDDCTLVVIRGAL